VAALVDLDVLRLQIPVDDAEPVRLSEPVAHLFRDARRAGSRGVE
jgi:hypothetical protein